MWRHKKERIVTQKFDCISFKPDWKAKKDCVEIVIMMDELEAIGLADVEWFDMKSAAKKMWISAPTFCRILASARKKVWTSVLKWYVLTICPWNNEK